MPCSDPVMSARDERASKAARVILALESRGWLSAPPNTKDAWLWPSGERLDELTAFLCDFCKRVGEEFIYNGRDRDCRQLADWWDEHKRLDEAREQGRS